MLRTEPPRPLYAFIFGLSKSETTSWRFLLPGVSEEHFMGPSVFVYHVFFVTVGPIKVTAAAATTTTIHRQLVFQHSSVYRAMKPTDF
jgi:hypothetical protein